MLHCESCWCVVCQVVATKCKFWDSHCKQAKIQVKSETAKKIDSGSESRGETMLQIGVKKGEVGGCEGFEGRAR
jgi:hypothetical protein